MAQLEAKFHDEVPITRGIDVRVKSYTTDELQLYAPLEPNINDKNTAFGGSLYSIAALSGWGWMYLRMKEEELPCDLAIYKGEIIYRRPVQGDFSTSCKAPRKEEFQQFLERFKEKGKARLELTSEIFSGEEVAATFTGIYSAYT